jgi:hypothetical protein
MSVLKSSQVFLAIRFDETEPLVLSLTLCYLDLSDMAEGLL